MSEATQPAELRVRARRYRAMVILASDERVIRALVELADEYEALADQLENRNYAEGRRNRSADGDES
jgi:hypothetical protein